MNCSHDLVEAYFDRELDATQVAAVQQHLAECQQCSAQYSRLQALRAGINSSAPYFRAPQALESSIRSALKNEQPAAVRSIAWRGLAVAASVLLAVSLSWNVYQLSHPRGREELGNAVVAEHVRSLLAGHTMEVASSDQHTVKPWFAGKLDFSPKVVDLAAQGFPLDGGRVDYLDERRVAALLYHRRRHIITLFIWPSNESTSGQTLSRNGYNALHWSEGGMTYWAVSDVSMSDLETFHSLLR